jgi:nucleotide-binding universal stress UspA family protein
MAFPQRVLAATDLSAPADEAIRQADVWARAAEARLAVCHVLPNPLRANPLFPELNARMAIAATTLAARAGRELEERVSALSGRGPGELEVRVEEGDPLPMILRFAEQWDADLLVVGSHGASGVPRILLGSVGDRAVRYAHCSVLVARSCSRSGQVLAATDLSAASLPAVTAAAGYARRHRARLSVLHAVDPGLSFAAYTVLERGGPPLTSLEETGRRAREAAERSLAETLTRLEVRAEVLVEDGPAAPAILRAADRLGADLVVVGTHGRTGLERLALGSIAETVVRAAACPVLVLRPGKRGRHSTR